MNLLATLYILDNGLILHLHNHSKFELVHYYTFCSLLDGFFLIIENLCRLVNLTNLTHQTST